MAHSQQPVDGPDHTSNALRRYAWRLPRPVTTSMQSNGLKTSALSHADKAATASRLQAAEARIADLEMQLQALSLRIHQDALTGALNRRGLDDMLQREMARAQRRHTPLSLAMIDLDDFKTINDTHGHSVGDEVLVHMVSTVQRALRPTDGIGRFGGEEFLLILPDTPLQPARQTVMRLQALLAASSLRAHQQVIDYTFSAGVAQLQDRQTSGEVITISDRALYRAKSEGKNCVLAAA